MKVAPSPLVELARARGLPVLQPNDTRDADFVGQMRGLKPDVLLVASYGEILREELLTLGHRGALNVHASLLPRHRGASPIQAAILAGDAETGVSVQRMVLRLDAGDVLLELRTPIGPNETSGELLARLAQLGAQAALRALDEVEGGKARFVPQDESRATLARKLQKQHGRVDWNKDARELERLVRALNPWPLARCPDGQGGELALLAVRALEGAPCARPGTLLSASEGAQVACGSGALELLRVKPAGKAAMDGAAWLRGARLPAGTLLAGT
jgi:methionyl-tRNA formyltransferase